jgi:hypothetical protein
MGEDAPKGRFITRILRHELAAERIGEDSLIEAIEKCRGPLGFVR